jgi:hypothetical protein
VEADLSGSDKATEELAKLGQKALETADKTGGWVDSVFGEGFRQIGDAFADSMTGWRIRNRLRVLEKTRKAIEAAGMAGNTRPLAPRISVPLLEAISDESDETIQDVWATYIKDAVDPERPQPDRILIDVIRRLEPLDWPILKVAFANQVGKLVSADFGVGDQELTEALDRMEVLRLFDYDDDTTHYLVLGKGEEKRLMIAIGNSEYYATRLLRKLADATKDRWTLP